MDSYQNFKAAIYCPVGNLIDITDFDRFGKRFDWIEKHINVGKVYLETYRHGTTIEKEQIERVIAFFKERGIETAGGITTDGPDDGEGGFNPLCYTSRTTRRMLTEVITFTASLFDEIILDDFYFTNCRCDSCIEAKGTRTWSSFRLELMKEISEEVIVHPAKQVNANVKMVIKYPNWYEHFQDAGYNLEDQPKIFDALYTGTETRNPMYTQQHLPKYLSYFNMRYMENVAPGRNGGGWYDPYECSYNLTSYAEQAYLTLFAKAKEAMMFSLGSLLHSEFSLCVPMNGQIFSDMDKYLGRLGNPVGTACYLPYHSHGEDYLHNYIGMLGIPLEPYPEYPKEAKTVFLTEGASMDSDILNKISYSLRNGADVVVTSGFLKEASKLGFQHELCNVNYTDRKAIVNSFAYSNDGGIRFGGREEAAKSIVIPQLEYKTNDNWEIIAGYGEDNSFPMLLKTLYGKGRLYILTIPEDYGDLYHLPRKILLPLRQMFYKDYPILLDSISKIGLFLYDNDCFAIHSFQPWYDEVAITLKGECTAIKDLVNENTIKAEQENGRNVVRIRLAPGINYVYQLVKDKRF
ncbi:MAG: permease [Anaerolineaceae bacterium]|nr:MAG: permease [Anaerolineaceae bacterium]